MRTATGRHGESLRRILLAIFIVYPFVPGALEAQLGLRTIRMAEVGSRVRIGVTALPTWSSFASLDHRVRDSIVGIAPDTLYVEVLDPVSTVAIPRILIQRVEVSLGVSRGASALEAGGVGAVILALLLPLVPTNLIDPGGMRIESDWYAAAVGAGAGFAVGALFGALRPHERWRRAWLPE